MFARLPAAFLAAGLLSTSVYLLLSLARWPAGDLEVLTLQALREEALEQRLETWRSLTAGKTRTAAELIAGRVTLRQAAERFRELNALLDDGNDEVVGPYRMGSGEEALWQNVLVWVRAELYKRADKATEAKVLARLKEEYREQFGHDPAPWSPIPPQGCSHTRNANRDIQDSEGE
jgi:hypothetical protein